jgi:hypothetical protein
MDAAGQLEEEVRRIADESGLKPAQISEILGTLSAEYRDVAPDEVTT